MAPLQARFKPARGGGVKYIDYKAKYKVLTMMRDHKALIFGPIYDKQTKAARIKKWKEIFAFAAKLDVVPRYKNYKYIRDVFWQNCKKYSTNKLLNCKKGKICKLTLCDKVSLEILGRGSEAEIFVNDSQHEGSNGVTGSSPIIQHDDNPNKASGSGTGIHDIDISKKDTRLRSSPSLESKISVNLAVASSSVTRDNKIPNKPSANDTSSGDTSTSRKRRTSHASIVKKIFQYLSTSNHIRGLPVDQSKSQITSQQTVRLPNIEDVAEGDENFSDMDIESDLTSNFSASSTNTKPTHKQLSAVYKEQHQQTLRKQMKALTLKERLEIQQLRLLNHKARLEIALMEKQLGYPSSKFTKNLVGAALTIKSEADTSKTQTTASVGNEPKTPLSEDTSESENTPEIENPPEIGNRPEIENPNEIENPPKIVIMPRRIVKLEKTTTATQTIESGEPILLEDMGETDEMPEIHPQRVRVAMYIPKLEPVDVNENVRIQAESNHSHCYDNHGAYYNNNGEVMYDVRINYGDYEYDSE